MSESAQRKCPKCGELRALDLFEYNAESGRRSYSCGICKRLKVDLPWDWACALKKATRMHVGKAQGREGTYYDALDEDMLRALWMAQEGKCALTQAPLRIPTIDELKKLSSNNSGNNVTLTAWKDTLPFAAQKFVPVLTRISMEGHWLPGNVILICNYLKDLCEAIGNIADLRSHCKTIAETPLFVPQRELLDRLRQDVVEQQLKARL